MRPHRFALLLSLGCALVACTLAFPVHVEEESKSSDSGADAARSDEGAAPLPDDGGADAGPWCASQGAATFCTDFDHGVVTDGWTDFFTTVRDAGSVALDDVARSAPKAARFTIPSLSPQPSCVNASLRRTFEASARTIHIHTALRTDTAASVQVMHLRLADSVCILGVEVGNQSFLNEVITLDAGAVNRIAHPLKSSVAPGEWHDVVLDVDRTSATAPTATLAVDGKELLSAQVLSSRCAEPGLIVLGIGFSCADDARTLLFDDVLLNLSP